MKQHILVQILHQYLLGEVSIFFFYLLLCESKPFYCFSKELVIRETDQSLLFFSFDLITHLLYFNTL